MKNFVIPAINKGQNQNDSVNITQLLHDRGSMNSSSMLMKNAQKKNQYYTSNLASITHKGDLNVPLTEQKLVDNLLIQNKRVKK